MPCKLLIPGKGFVTYWKRKPSGCYIKILKHPDWEQVFEKRSQMSYSIIVLNNNSGYSTEEISHFDYDLLERDFENALHT